MIEQTRDTHVFEVRIDQLEAQVERLKGALTATGVNPRLVDRIALGVADNWLSAVPDTTVDL